MEPASLTTWLQPLQLRTQSIQSVWKCQVLFRILQTFNNFNLLFIGQMIESQSEKCLAQNKSNISVGVHVGSSLIKVKDTHLMNNNQPVEILCWRLDNLVSKPLTLRRAERKNGSRTHSADLPRTPVSAPPPHRHSGNTQHENTETQKSAPPGGDRSATAPHKWKRTLKPVRSNLYPRHGPTWWG